MFKGQQVSARQTVLIRNKRGHGEEKTCKETRMLAAYCVPMVLQNTRQSCLEKNEIKKRALFLFCMFCRKRNLLSLFPFHFLLSLKLSMLLQTCNSIFLALMYIPSPDCIATFLKLYINSTILFNSKRDIHGRDGD